MKTANVAFAALTNGLLFVFIVGKAFNIGPVGAWSWWWVFSPIWVTLLFFVLLVAALWLAHYWQLGRRIKRLLALKAALEEADRLAKHSESRGEKPLLVDNPKVRDANLRSLESEIAFARRKRTRPW